MIDNMKVKDVSLRLPVSNANEVVVGDVLWVKATVEKIAEDGYITFEGNSPVNGYLISRKHGPAYEDVEIKIEKK